MKTTVDEIIALEWDMFQLVNENGPRADCQDEYETFYGMRSGQFSEWSENAQNSYRNDLKAALNSGRNLIEEKYVWMMMESYPESFMELSTHVAMPTEHAKNFADAICDRLMEQTAVLHERYPNVAGSGRPLNSVEGGISPVSIESYQYSELLTYSENTLESLYDHIMKLSSDGIMLAERILANSVKYYGYKSLDEAEASLRNH